MPNRVSTKAVAVIKKTKALDFPFKAIRREHRFFKPGFPGQVILTRKTLWESGGEMFHWTDGVLNCRQMKRTNSMFIYESSFGGGERHIFPWWNTFITLLTVGTMTYDNIFLKMI